MVAYFLLHTSSRTYVKKRAHQDFPFWKMGLFWCSQFTGAFIAGLFTFAMWQPGIVLFEKANNITRGAPGNVAIILILLL